MEAISSPQPKGIGDVSSERDVFFVRGGRSAALSRKALVTPAANRAGVGFHGDQQPSAERHW